MSLSPERRAEMERKLRELLSETKTTQANDTKTRKERRAAFENSYGAKPKTADLVARIEAAERIVWIPHSYVFFVRQATCRNCRTTVRCLEDANLFLQQRRGDRRDESNPYLYTPVKAIEHVNLPRRKILKPITVPICEACFEGSSCPTSISCAPDVTKSHTESIFQDQAKNWVIQASASGLPGQESMTSQSLYSLQPVQDSPLAAFVGSPSETAFGSECGEREFAPAATVEG
jgi:hypothetical protein